MSAPKIVLLVLILLAVLCAVGVGLGVGRDNKDADAEKGWHVDALGWLKQSLVPAEIKNVRGGQFQSRVFTLQPGLPCVAEIAASETSARSMTLKLIEGLKVGVHFVPNGDDGAESSTTLEPGDKTEKCSIAVFKQGGKLTLTSAALTPRCRVELVE